MIVIIVIMKLTIGQSLVPVINPVLEGNDFMATCIRPNETGAIFVRVNDVAGLVILIQQTLFSIFFTFPNVSRKDNGAVFTCVVPPGSTVIASLTLAVLCKHINYCLIHHVIKVTMRYTVIIFVMCI